MTQRHAFRWIHNFVALSEVYRGEPPQAFCLTLERERERERWW